MPELPEVETIRRQIAPDVTRRIIVSVFVTRDRAVRAHPTPTDFITHLTGRTLTAVNRRGKALLFPLDTDESLLVRLGMSGQLVLVDADAPLKNHTHVRLELDSGKSLRFIDPRTFGQMAVVNGHDPAQMPELAHYGPEPLDDSFTADILQEILAGRKQKIQTVLMNQELIVGIGKIYADEACYLARIHPERAAGSLTSIEVNLLHAAIRDVLTRAISNRGTSIKDAAYRDARGTLGGFQQQLNVYQREGKECRECGTIIEHRPIQGRRMHFCPKCQN
ncbi:MAG: bifunctional DNA-formamidopyrimidine glycosylase/DNA-(apurinic or apyrimidinic site) lyase [bacterium]